MDFKFIPQNGRITQQATEILIGSEIQARRAGAVIHKQYLNKKSKRATRAKPKILQSDGTLKSTYDTPFGKCYVVNSYSTMTSTREPYHKDTDDIDGVNQIFSGEKYNERHTGDIVLDGKKVSSIYINPKMVFKHITTLGGNFESVIEYALESFLQKLAEFKENLEIINQNNKNMVYIDFFKTFENRPFYKVKEREIILKTIWDNEEWGGHDGDILIQSEKFVGVYAILRETDEPIMQGLPSFGNKYIDEIYYGVNSTTLAPYGQHYKEMSGTIYSVIKYAYKVKNTTTTAQGENTTTYRTEYTSENIGENDTIIDIIEIVTNEIYAEAITENRTGHFDLLSLTWKTDNIEGENSPIGAKVGNDDILFYGANADKEAEKIFGKTIQGVYFFTNGAITTKGFLITERTYTTSVEIEIYANEYETEKRTTHEFYIQPLFYFNTDNPVCRWWFLLEKWDKIHKFSVNYNKGGWLSRHASALGFVLVVISIFTAGSTAKAGLGPMATTSSYLGSVALALTGINISLQSKTLGKISTIVGAVGMLAGIGAIGQKLGEQTAKEAVKQVAQESAKNFSKEMAQKTATSLFDKFMNSTIIQYVKMGFKAISAINDFISAFRGGDLPNSGEKAQTQQEIDNENKKKFVDTTLPDEILQDGKPKLLSDKWLPNDRLDLWNG